MTVPAVGSTSQSSLYTDPSWNSTTKTPVKPGADTASATGDNTSLSSKAFLQLIVAQLQYQDPSKPVDSAAFMQETATLSQVQSTEANAQNNADILTSSRAQTASSLLGMTVTYLSSNGSAATGVVSSANISSSLPTLKIGEDTVPLTSVQQVSTPTTAK